jgi:hypothetical protein
VLLHHACTAAGIVQGTAGYSDLGRRFWREQGAAAFIMDGNEKTCIADSLVVCAQYAGKEIVDKEKIVRDLTSEDGGELPLFMAINYCGDQVCLPSYPPSNMH